MIRERALQVVLALIGLVFLALSYPMVVFFRQEPALSMMLSVYAVLGVFLLLALPHPEAHRSLLAFTAWSSLAHAALMGTQAWAHIVEPGEWIGVGVLCGIGVVLLALAPRARLSA